MTSPLEKIGRSAGSVAMKLSNFTSLDPEEAALENYNVQPDDSETSIFPEEIENTTAVVKIRRHQRFFRKIVLSSYQDRCAISQLPVKELLIASHIKPWSADPQNRLNPRNGLCLAVNYDKAFDRRFIGFNENLELTLSTKLKDLSTTFSEESDIPSVFERFEGQSLVLPEQNLPDPALVQWHFENVFQN